MTKHSLNHIRVWVAAFAIVTLILTLFRNEYYIVAEQNDTLLFAWAADKGERFEVEFVHSLNLSPIVDVFEVTGEGFILRESIFSSLGAGSPTPADHPGSELIHSNGVFRLIGIDKPMNSLTILTQDTPNHRISFGEREAFLLELVGSGKSVTIEIKRLPLAARLIIGLP